MIALTRHSLVECFKDGSEAPALAPLSRHVCEQARADVVTHRWASSQAAVSCSR